MYDYDNPVLGGTWKDKEKVILKNCKSLRLENFTHDTSLSLAEFISNFILNYNGIYRTEEENSTEYVMSCYNNRQRSLLDIFLICKYYYPDCTLESVKDLLFSVKYIHINICNGIKRRVYYKSTIDRTIQNMGSPSIFQTDEFGLPLISSMYETSKVEEVIAI